MSLGAPHKMFKEANDLQQFIWLLNVMKCKVNSKNSVSAMIKTELELKKNNRLK
jgi:hypothetical protein